MSLSLIIHRGSHEIGGNALEIIHEKMRLLLDIGLPLSSFDTKNSPAAYRVSVSGLYKEETPSVSAVFLTHAHLDHTGLLCEINEKIPVYASPATIALLQNVSVLLGAPSVGHIRFIPITNGQTVAVGNIRVTARAVDHSAAQSLAYEVTDGIKKIVYTGDLRLHGTCSYLTRRFMRTSVRPDVLLLEGTTLNRTSARAPLTEKGLQTQFLRLLQNIPKDVLPVVYFSAQNLDRFISVYKTARALQKTLVIDPYTCYTLEQLKTVSPSVVQYNWRNIRVYFAPNRLTRALADKLKRYAVKKIDLPTILRAPDKFLIKDNTYVRRQLLARTNRLYFIHSAWEGYLKKDSLLQQDARQYGITIAQLHTSGHGDVRALQTLVNKVRPKLLIPVHTDVPERYQQLFSAPVRLLKDGERLTL